MDAVKFLQTRRRMCNAEWCYLCPLGIESNERCVTWLFTHPAEAVAIVEEWDVKHPVKTNADKFKDVFGFDVKECGFGPNRICLMGIPHKYWSQEPYEEPKTNGDAIVDYLKQKHLEEEQKVE